MDKLNYSEVIKSIGLIHFGDMGWEFIAFEDLMSASHKIDFMPKSSATRDYSSYTKQEIKHEQASMRAVNRDLALWKKGVRSLMTIAKKEQHPVNSFWRLYKSISQENIVKIGKEGTHTVYQFI